jgi:hypothetical protein
MSPNPQHDNNCRFVYVLFTFITAEIYSSWIVGDFIFSRRWLTKREFFWKLAPIGFVEGSKVGTVRCLRVQFVVKHWRLSNELLGATSHKTVLYLHNLCPWIILVLFTDHEMIPAKECERWRCGKVSCWTTSCYFPSWQHSHSEFWNAWCFQYVGSCRNVCRSYQ